MGCSETPPVIGLMKVLFTKGSHAYPSENTKRQIDIGGWVVGFEKESFDVIL